MTLLKDQPLETRISNIISRLGLPTVIACFLLYWSFYIHVPQQEHRMQTLIEDQTKQRQEQGKLMMEQAALFRQSIQETVAVVKKLEEAVQGLALKVEKLSISSEEKKELKSK